MYDTSVPYTVPYTDYLDRSIPPARDLQPIRYRILPYRYGEVQYRRSFSQSSLSNTVRYALAKGDLKSSAPRHQAAFIAS